ncbi:hypothetical protein IU414_18120 [Nocardia farcinica]|nr:hypothetical protein [Nocardia farcinica]MBF6265491.1 hypothetical protein [Nocardia farcinica]MBF6284091.1 hypothetical protein [Nocardia farcinica]MBF6308124.1 hypothetical protein [Nocardia farcinica]MBF6511630.1 hypothetical protein [Nocardia farcinica]
MDNPQADRYRVRTSQPVHRFPSGPQGSRWVGGEPVRTPPITQEHRYRLPARDRLLIALCRGLDDTDPICSWARELVQLHGARRESSARAAECDCRRTELIARINDLTNTVEPLLAITYPQTIGVLIDRMAVAAEQAMHQLAASGARSERMHQAWTQLAELELEYSDLVSDLFYVDNLCPPHPSTDTGHKR